MAFGDLFLEDIRRYREGKLAGSGITPLFPLWGIDTGALAREMIAGGLVAHVTCVDPRKLPTSFAGRRFDRALLAELPAGVDPCAENGEFHTFACAGPMFSRPIAVEAGEVVTRDGFVFCDFRFPSPRVALLQRMGRGLGSRGSHDAPEPASAPHPSPLPARRGEGAAHRQPDRQRHRDRVRAGAPRAGWWGAATSATFRPTCSTLPALTAPKFKVEGSSAEIDARVREIVRDGLSVYRVDGEALKALEPDVIVTQDHCEVCAVSLARRGGGHLHVDRASRSRSSR